MSTVSFSVEEDIKKDIAAWAKSAKKSKSDIFRDMVNVYNFNRQFDDLTAKTGSTLQRLGIKSEDELYQYLETDETYQNRLRHQRLPGRN